MSLGRFRHSAKQDEDAAKPQKPEEVLGLVLPARYETAEVLQPRKQPFDQPTALCAAKLSPVLPAPTRAFTAPLRSNEFDSSLFSKLNFMFPAVPSSISDEVLRQFINKCCIESLVRQDDIVTVASSDADGQRQPLVGGQRHDFGRLACTAPANALPPFLAFA